MFPPGQACHVGPAVFSRVINLHRGQGSGVVPPTHRNQTLGHCAQIKIHPSLVHRGALQRHTVPSGRRVHAEWSGTDRRFCYDTLVHWLCRGSYLYSRLHAASPPLSLDELPPAAKMKPPNTARQWWLRWAGSSVSTSHLPASLSSRETVALSCSPCSDTWRRERLALNYRIIST